MSGRKSKLHNTQLHSLIFATKEKEFYTHATLGVKRIEDSWKKIAEEIKTPVLFVTTACEFILPQIKINLFLKKVFYIFCKADHIFSMV